MLAVRLLEKNCKYMWKTNSVVHMVMLHNFYTNVFIRIRFFLRNKQLEKLKENICDV